MATYKVPQDIEAEDKILGPLGIRQLVYVIVVGVMGFICFRLIVSNLWYLALPFLPPMMLFGILAAPLGGDQPTETWLIAKVRFFFKPRVRIWDQAGIKQLVTITVPKKEERSLTKGFSQNEVKSRLEALANTLDSRGWAVKNVNINMFSQPAFSTVMQSADRLVATPGVQQVPESDIQAADDMLNAAANPLAHQIDAMLTNAATSYKEQVTQNMQLKNPISQSLVDEKQAIAAIKAGKARDEEANRHMRRVSADHDTGKSPVNTMGEHAKLELADTEGLTVATVASLANRQAGDKDDDEVVIPLR